MASKRNFNQRDLDELAEAMLDISDLLADAYAEPTIGDVPRKKVESTIETLRKYSTKNNQIAFQHDRLVKSYEQNYDNPKKYKLIHKKSSRKK